MKHSIAPAAYGSDLSGTDHASAGPPPSEERTSPPSSLRTPSPAPERRKISLNDRILLQVGLWGMLVAAVSWLSPLVSIALHAGGLFVSRNWIDSISAPAFGMFMGQSMWALVRMGRLEIVNLGCCYVPIPEELKLPPRQR